MIVCNLSEACPHYDNGDGRMKGHHSRTTAPCKKFLDMSCEMELNIRVFFGETIACDIDKMRRLKGK